MACARWLRLLFAASLLAGCASLASLDRSYVNQPPMDLRDPNLLGAPSPGTGLRNMQKTANGGSCAVCAH